MKNKNEDWSLGVKGRVEKCTDFVASDIKHHIKCYLRLTVDKELLSDNSKRCHGRTINLEMVQYFNQTCEWLENESVRDIQFPIFKRK